MVGKKVAAEATLGDALSYITTVKEAFHGEPAKFEDFLKLLDAHRSGIVDQASFVASLEQLFKDHPNLVDGFNAFLPAASQIFIPPEPDLPDIIERKRDDADNLLKKIKERFQGCDTHVPDSFAKIMEDFQERKKLEKEVQEEVLNLLYGHEDLIEEFLRLLQ